MVTRPTDRWRAEVKDDAAQIAAGSLSPDEAWAARLWSNYLLAHTDTVLDGFNAAVHNLRDPSDEEIMATVKEVVLRLNQVNADLRRRHETPYETGEREELCDYIDNTLKEAGIDMDALTARLEIGRYEFTDEWRDW